MHYVTAPPLFLTLCIVLLLLLRLACSIHSTGTLEMQMLSSLSTYLLRMAIAIALLLLPTTMLHCTVYLYAVMHYSLLLVLCTTMILYTQY